MYILANRFVLFSLIFFTVFSQALAAPKEDLPDLSCLDSLELPSDRILDVPIASSKQNVLPGAILYIKSKLSAGLGDDNELLVGNGLPISPDHSYAHDNYLAQAGDFLEVIHEPKRVGGNSAESAKVRHIDSGFEGLVYWNILRLSTLVVVTGKAPEVSNASKATKMKFPLSQDPEAEGKGLTRYGRPLPLVGQIVWLGNLPRSMSPSNIGKVVEIMDNSGTTAAFIIAKIELINGKYKSEYINMTIPMESEEIKEAKEKFGDKIKVDWF